MSAANTLSPSKASEVAGENSESASVAQRSSPSAASRARTRRSAEPTKTDPPPAVGADPAVELACNDHRRPGPFPRRRVERRDDDLRRVGVASDRVHLAVRDRERGVDAAVEVLRPRDGSRPPARSRDRAFLIPDEGVRAVDRDPAPGDAPAKGFARARSGHPGATATSVEESPSSSWLRGKGSRRWSRSDRRPDGLADGVAGSAASPGPGPRGTRGCDDPRPPRSPEPRAARRPAGPATRPRRRRCRSRRRPPRPRTPRGRRPRRLPRVHRRPGPGASTPPGTAAAGPSARTPG